MQSSKGSAKLSQRGAIPELLSLDDMELGLGHNRTRAKLQTRVSQAMQIRKPISTI